MNKFLKLSALLLLVVLFTGCAKYVTDKNVIGGETISPTKYMEITATFAGVPANNSLLKYYLVVSSQNMRIIEATKSDPYFIAPVETSAEYEKAKVKNAYTELSSEDDFQPLYNSYFNTWDYIYTYDIANSLRFYPGPFVVSANQGAVTLNTSVGIANMLSGTSYQLKFKVPIPEDRNNFKVNFLCIDTGHYLRARLDSDLVIEYANNKDFVGQITRWGSIDPSVDMISFTVRTYEY